MYGRVAYDNENVFLNGRRILGVKSFDGQLGFSRNPVSILGAGYVGQSLDGEISRSFSMTKYIGDSEADLLNLAGSEIAGRFKFKSSRNDFSQEWVATKARMSSYEISCRVGEIPESSISFEAIGAVGFSGENVENEDEISGSFTVVRPGDLIVSGSAGFDNNRLQSFTYSLNMPSEKKHLIGSEFRPYFSQNSPVEVSVSMEFDLDSLGDDLFELPLCEKDFSARFSFNKCGEEIRSFTVSGAELTNSSVNGSVGSNATFSATYKGYYNDISEAIVGATT